MLGLLLMMNAWPEQSPAWKERRSTRLEVGRLAPERPVGAQAVPVRRQPRVDCHSRSSDFGERALDQVSLTETWPEWRRGWVERRPIR